MISLADALKSSHYQSLKGVAERGVANAAAGLSDMVGREIDMRALDVSIMSVEQVPRLLAGPEELVVGIYLSISGDITGHILLLMSPDEARWLADMLMDLPRGTTRSLGTMERSALGEVGNLTGSFFLNALAEITQLQSQPSPPAVIMDMGSAILDIPLLALALSSDEVFVINTAFVQDERQVQSVFLVMPEMSSLQAILDCLGRNGD